MTKRAKKTKHQRCTFCKRGNVSFVGRTRLGRPEFGCTNCEYTFTMGDDGGQYKHLVPKEST